MGIGTNLVTCQAQPALGVVYKVVEFKGTPRIKMSDEAEKILVPGAKSTMRALTEDNKPLFDVMCLRTEQDEFINGKSNSQDFFDYKNGGVKISQADRKDLHHFAQCTVDLLIDGKSI